ncbi:hypothetical protein LEMLEM_LOCUS5363 [Lemmus lemmus]
MLSRKRALSDLPTCGSVASWTNILSTAQDVSLKRGFAALFSMPTVSRCSEKYVGQTDGRMDGGTNGFEIQTTLVFYK